MQCRSDVGAKPRYPIFFTLDRNWVLDRFFRFRCGGVGLGLGFGGGVGRLLGGGGANVADAGGRVTRRGFYDAVDDKQIKCQKLASCFKI